jgi:hypothetical protein
MRSGDESQHSWKRLKAINSGMRFPKKNAAKSMVVWGVGGVTRNR